MSPRHLIVCRTNPSRGYYKNRDVLELPDAEHVHLHRQADGTYTAVPMREVGGVEFTIIGDDGVAGRMGVGRSWVDAPTGGDA